MLAGGIRRTHDYVCKIEMESRQSKERRRLLNSWLSTRIGPIVDKKWNEKAWLQVRTVFDSVPEGSA
ncbi:unnamed protein product [Caretta caretta]